MIQHTVKLTFDFKN